MNNVLKKPIKILNLTRTNCLDDLVNEFDDFNTGGMFSQGFTGSVAEIGAFAAQEYGFDLVANNPFATNRTIEEDITAVYFELDL